jgi:hypothetical protein
VVTQLLVTKTLSPHLLLPSPFLSHWTHRLPLPLASRETHPTATIPSIRRQQDVSLAPRYGPPSTATAMRKSSGEGGAPSGDAPSTQQR